MGQGRAKQGTQKRNRQREKNRNAKRRAPLHVLVGLFTSLGNGDSVVFLLIILRESSINGILAINDELEEGKKKNQRKRKEFMQARLGT